MASWRCGGAVGVGLTESTNAAFLNVRLPVQSVEVTYFGSACAFGLLRPFLPSVYRQSRRNEAI